MAHATATTRWPRRRLLRLLAPLVAVGLLAAGCDYVHAPFLGRLDQPVVLTGADLPGAIGLVPDRALAFRHAGNAGWVQIPVQVDERHVVDFGSAPGNNTTPGTVGTVYGTSPIGVTHLQYSDPGTFVGADPDPTFDADDELVFMARDAGKRAPAGTPPPAAATGGLGYELSLAELGGGGEGWVYLFYGAPGVDPSAGEDYVDYDFSLTSGDYTTTYKRATGPNPETSTVSTYAYDAGMIDRWKTTDLRIASGTGVDVLDGYKARFAFSTCGRSNQTFAAAEGAFVANIDGPVRAIRSYIGANSGPLTQETVRYYAERIDFVTDLRVHAIPSVMSYFDFSTAANGMSYRNSEMEAPVTVDGAPDTVPGTQPEWEYVAGPQGALTVATELSTSISTLSLSLDYVDDSTPPFQECWGSDGLWGAAAHNVTGGIPNTDPRSTPFATFSAVRTVGIWPADLDADAWTPGWAEHALEPLSVGVGVYSG